MSTQAQDRRPDPPGSAEDPLDPRFTANLISAADLVTIALTLTALYLHAGSVAGLQVFPVSLAAAAVAGLIIRLILLQALAQGWKAIVRGGREILRRLNDVTFQSIIGKPPRPHDDRPLPARLITDAARVRDHRTTWYVLLGLGMLSQALLVAATGGLVESPFTELLVATFVLGQFRSPTGTATWTLFGIGVICASLAHFIYLLLTELRREAMETQHWGSVAHLAPLLIVGLMSTVVSFFLRKSEDERAEPDADNPAYARVTDPGTRPAPDTFTVVTEPVDAATADTTATSNNATATPSTAVAPNNAAVAPNNAAVAPNNAAVAPNNAAVAPNNAAVAPNNAAVAPNNAARSPVTASRHALIAGSTTQRRSRDGTATPAPPLHAVSPNRRHVSLCGTGVQAFPAVPYPTGRPNGTEVCPRCQAAVDAL